MQAAGDARASFAFGLYLLWQDPAEGNHEKLLLKLATKGVVKLFNVIQQQQKIRNEEKGRADAGWRLQALVH